MADIRDRHADHDPMLIASLLDDDLGASERASAEARIATCGDCAALRADLVALSSATRTLPTPSRGRDFRLTPADAARLAGTRVGEPGTPAARLSGVMNGTRDHASHDTLLVAALADRSLAGPERAAAERLVADCSLCARLHTDLVAISVATREMPAPARTREFTLTPADAERLRPNGWRRFVAAFGTSRDGFSRPLAAGLTAIGLAGLLFAALPSIGGQQETILSTVGNAVGAGSEAQRVTDQANPAASDGLGFVPVPAASAAAASAAAAPIRGAASAAPFVPAGESAQPVLQPAAVDSGKLYAPNAEASEDVYTGSGEGPGSVAASGDASAQGNDLAGKLGLSDGDGSNGPSSMMVLSSLLLFVGLALFAIRWTARRLGRD